MDMTSSFFRRHLNQSCCMYYVRKPCDLFHDTLTYMLLQNDRTCQLVIEGFGGKRALGFLLKIELCRKRSKFRMQFCLGALNNVLYVFLLKFTSFMRYYVCKKACICCLISM